MTCFYLGYNPEPIVVIGPHWPYALAMVFATNLLIGIPVATIKDSSWMFPIFVLTLLLWNLLTFYLILINPGLSPLDPHIHTKSYLRAIERHGLDYRVCDKCQLIQEEDGKYMK